MGNDKDKETTIKIRKMKSGTNNMRVNQMKEKATRSNTDHPKKEELHYKEDENSTQEEETGE
jgi:hypothetical protein